MGKHRSLILALTSCLLALAFSSHQAIAAGPPSPRAASPTPQQSTPPPQSAAVAQPKPRPAGADSDVERAIRARFAKSKISTDGFTVRVEGGAAIIEGKTGIIQHKGTATRLAKLAGARRVDNRIEISAAAREKAAAHLASGKRVHVQTGKSN